MHPTTPFHQRLRAYPKRENCSTFRVPIRVRLSMQLIGEQRLRPGIQRWWQNAQQTIHAAVLALSDTCLLQVI